MALKYKFLIGDSYPTIKDFMDEPNNNALYTALTQDPFISKSIAIDELPDINFFLKVLTNPKVYLKDYLNEKKRAIFEAYEKGQKAYQDFLKTDISNPMDRAIKIYNDILKEKNKIIDREYDSRSLKEAEKRVFGEPIIFKKSGK